ncbi:MAG: sodium:solute symporter family protein, partial [Cytophagales bacterium]|nr:sodium:solute symporter family protein [Cytophagales bacterium]
MMIRYLSLDHCIVYLFLLLIAVVGWYVGRKNKDITEYAIANKMFGTLVLTITLLATYVGGATTVGQAANVFSDGIILTVVSIFSCIPLLFTALFIAPKVDNLKGCITMGDVMGKFYGELGRITTGVIGAIYALLIIAIQVGALGCVNQALLGIKASTGMIISGVIMVFYAFYGGIKAVTITDVIQFAVLIFMIPLIAFVATDHVGGARALMNKVPAEKFIIWGHEKFYYYAVIFIVWCVFPTFALNPPMVQRILMGQSKQQVRRVFLISAVFIPFFIIMMMFIGLSALASAPEIKANVALPHLVNKLFSVGIKGLVVAGLLAVIMSTGDSFLNAGGVLLTHDVVKPICDKKNKVINELKLTKYLTLVVGIVSICLSLLSEDLIKVSFWAASLFGSTITLPFIVGVLGLRTDAKSFFTAFWVTVATFVVASLYLASEKAYLAPLFSTLANGISFFGMHLVQHQGIALAHADEAAAWKRRWQHLRKQFIKALPTPENLLQYCQRETKEVAPRPFSFIVFCLFYYFIAYAVWALQKTPYNSAPFMLGVIALVLWTGLLGKKFWPEHLQKYFPVYWYACLFYCLPF